MDGFEADAVYVSLVTVAGFMALAGSTAVGVLAAAARHRRGSS